MDAKNRTFKSKPFWKPYQSTPPIPSIQFSTCLCLICNKISFSIFKITRIWHEIVYSLNVQKTTLNMYLLLISTTVPKLSFANQSLVVSFQGDFFFLSEGKYIRVFSGRVMFEYWILKCHSRVSLSRILYITKKLVNHVKAFQHLYIYSK